MGSPSRTGDRVPRAIVDDSPIHRPIRGRASARLRRLRSNRLPHTERERERGREIEGERERRIDRWFPRASTPLTATPAAIDPAYRRVPPPRLTRRFDRSLRPDRPRSTPQNQTRNRRDSRLVSNNRRGNLARDSSPARSIQSFDTSLLRAHVCTCMYIYIYIYINIHIHTYIHTYIYKK